MKLLVCDVEGTIFKAKYKIDGTDYASTMWQPLAQTLGPVAIAEERETHKKWENKEYDNYIAWVEATVEIHKKHGLQQNIFNSLIETAEYIDGVLDFFANIDRNKYIPVLVSGGFQELIRRAQRDLNINYGYAACEYFFDSKTGLLNSYSLTPCDFEGKYKYIQALFDVYGLNPKTDWVFIGDGKNDIHIAQKAPLSFGISAHPDLSKIVTHNIKDFSEISAVIQDEEGIIYLSPDYQVGTEELDGQIDGEYASIIAQRDAAIDHAKTATAALSSLQDKVRTLNGILREELEKQNASEVVLKDLESKLQVTESERAEIAKQVHAVEIELKGAAEEEKAELTNQLSALKNEVTERDFKIESILENICEYKELLSDASQEISEKENELLLLNTLNSQHVKQNAELTAQLETLVKKLETIHESRRKEIQDIWFIHFPHFIFKTESIKDIAKLFHKDRIKVEEKLRSLHDAPDPRSLSRGRLRGASNNDHMEVRLSDGFPARIEYDVTSENPKRIEIIKFYKHNDKYMQ